MSNFETSLDDKFSKVETLTWIPWIGKKYADQTKKLLIVGESHYEWTQEEDDVPSTEYLSNKSFTRDFIDNRGLHFLHENGNASTPFLRNFERAFFNNAYPTNEDKLELWTKSAYINLIQRPMETKNHRPIDPDFELGWENFFSVIDILKPNICLFLGVEASKNIFYLQQSAKKRNLELPEVIFDEQIGNTYGRTVNLNFPSQKLEMFFVKHPSKFFSWSKWHPYIDKKLQTDK